MNTEDKFWQFSPIPNIEESNFNKILERFYGMRVAGLVRENIQNSMDGRLVNSTGPVVVTIETGSINKQDIPGIEEVIERICCLEGRNSYTKETIQHMVNKLVQNNVRYISFEDSNTRGLTGAKNGQSNSAQDTWGIYAYNKGFHFEESDETFETSRGGSHGVGKIASNAASDLHIMYFANCDENGDQHLGGTVQLIEHIYEGRCYRSTGYFTDIHQIDENKTKFYPFENTFHNVFEKKTRGLKIIIPFLREEYDNEDEIIKSVCDSFFISILEGRLEVLVNDKKISKNTIEQYVKNSNYYVQEYEDMKKEFTPLYIDTYLNMQPQDLVVSNGERDYNFKLYFKYDESISKGRVAIIRTIGMKIEDLKVKGNVNKPFNAVLIGGPEEDTYLKSLENESHTELSFEHIKDPILLKYAKRFINNLSREVAKIIEEAIKRRNPTDGAMNTSDILYIVETQFKQDLSNALGTVMINKGKTVVKANVDIPMKKKNKRKKGNGDKPGKPEVTPDPLKKKKKRQNPEDTEQQKKPTEVYSVNPNIVNRVIIDNTEFIQFDFTQSQEITSEKNCNISFHVIDGMGVEYDNEFKMNESYVQVIDQQSGNSCVVKDNVINNVAIQKGMSQLKLQFSPNYNKALKFIYYVEV